MIVDWRGLIVTKGPEWAGAVIGFLALRSKLVDIHLTLNSRLDKLIKASEDVGAQRERDLHSITVPGVPEK